MLTIDGSPGGGQVLRSALALSILNDRPVRIEAVRGGRDRPGLRPQHLAGIAVLAELTDATVEGDAIGSDTVEFVPEVPPGGSVDIDIGTAGALSLLFDTVACLGPVAKTPVTVTATGGTDVKWAPTMDYLQAVKRPVMAEHGLPIDVTVTQRGFYPVGEGIASITVHPAAPTALDLDGDATLEGATVVSRASESLQTADVAERQATAASSTIEAAGVEVDEEVVSYHDVPSTGTSATVIGRFDRGYGGGDAVGERGRPAESVGETAATDVLEAAEAPGRVDRHLADQLLVPLAVAGGSLRLPVVTDHVETNLTVIDAFGFDIERDGSGPGTVLRA